MCKLCEAGLLQNHFGSRRNFLKGLAATGLATGGLKLFAPRPALAQFNYPAGSGDPNRRYVIQGGSVMSMDPGVGDFAQANVVVEGKKIVAVGPGVGEVVTSLMPAGASSCPASSIRIITSSRRRYAAFSPTGY